MRTLANGRSDARPKKAAHSPGEFYVGHTLAMLQSPAWRALPDKARRLLSRLEVEHLVHKGGKNGQLACTYEELIAAGISRKLIRLAIEQAEQLGFLECQHGKSASSAAKFPNRYRLTYVKSFKGETPETNEWAQIASPSAARMAVKRAKAIVEAERLKTGRAKKARAAKESMARHGGSTGRAA